jgi:Fe-S-cluster-containing dehydrogenase component
MAANSPEEIGTSLESKSSAKLSSEPKKSLSRRDFLKGAGLAGLGVASLYIAGCAQLPEAAAALVPAPATRQVFVPKALMMVLGDPTRCVGCRRCEIACTTFNEGVVQPVLARVKINRNYMFGTTGIQPGFFNTDGIFGNGRIVQDTCRQCPHPVPCLDACPAGAIEIDPKTNARVVNTAKCTGCKTCLRACPWAMTTFNYTTNKASKCHLCGGNPECVKACPTGALQYVPWVDKTKEIPARYTSSAIDLPADVKAACVECHPGTTPAPTK